MQIAAWPASAKIFSVVAFRVDQPEQALFQDGVISVPQRQGEAQQLLHDCILFYEYFHGDNGAGIGASHQTGWTGIVAKLIELFGYLDPDVFLETPDLLKVSASAPLASTNAESPR